MESALVLKLSDNQRKALIDSFKFQLEAARLQVTELTDLLEQLGGSALLPSVISESQSTVVHEIGVLEKSPITSEFKRSWSWGQKIKFIITKIGHCLTSREIANELIRYDPTIEDPFKSISTNISLKVSNGVLFKRYKVFEDENTNPNQFTYYVGLKEWFDEEGNLIDEEYRGKE